MFFFFKQKTAYEMRISDWSSDVCSSDLTVVPARWRWLLRARASDAGCNQLQPDIRPNLVSIDQNIGESERVEHPEEYLQRFAQRGQIGRASCRERVCQYV